MAEKVSRRSFSFIFLSSVIVVVVFGIRTCEAQAKVPAVYVFGDSLVDVGNNNYLKLSLAKADFPHNGVDFPGKKPTGRFSNGKNSADFLAEKVGLVTPPPYLSLVSNSNKPNAFPITGVSFASGGAGIFNATDKSYVLGAEYRRMLEDDVVHPIHGWTEICMLMTCCRFIFSF
ncbi:hypothetical protein U1Q18_000432 [Sarracenia purpurea var. burkii]